jgi:ABC-type nitrate/sulfonate/bicarbonate transport system substrate-binding protein
VGGFSIFNTSFVENKPEIAAAVKRAMDRASQYINENPEKSLVILAKYTGYDSKLLKGMSFGNYWTLELIDKEAVQNMADILYNAGLVTKQIDTSHWYYKN